MTQKNIDTMSTIVDVMARGATLSIALKRVYSQRNVTIPFNDKMFSVDIRDLHMSPRTTNSLMRAHLKTINDVVKYCQEKKITSVKTLGVNSSTELFEAILNYCWDCMNKKERTEFLIDTVERNAEFIRS